MDPNGDNWWWTIVAYEWPYQRCDNDGVDNVLVDENDDHHDFVDDVLIDVDDDDADAMYDILDNGIHLSSTTFEWLNGIKKNQCQWFAICGKKSYVLLVNILNWNPCLDLHST